MSQALPRPNLAPTRAPRAAQPSLGFLRRRWRAATRLFNRLNGITPAEVYREDIDELLRPTFT